MKSFSFFAWGQALCSILVYAYVLYEWVNPAHESRVPGFILSGVILLSLWAIEVWNWNKEQLINETKDSQDVLKFFNLVIFPFALAYLLLKLGKIIIDGLFKKFLGWD